MEVGKLVGTRADKNDNGAQALDRLLRLAEVKAVVGLGKTLIYRLIGAGEFPAPYKPSGSVARWSQNELNDWLARCAARRR